MLEQQRVPYRRIDLPYPLHSFIVQRALRFDGDTVPALVLDGQRLQQTRTIARALGVASGADEEWLELEMRRLKRRLVRHRVSHQVPPELDATLARIDWLPATDPATSAELHAAVLVRLIGCFVEVDPDRPAMALTGRLCPVSRYPGRLAKVL